MKEKEHIAACAPFTIQSRVIANFLQDRVIVTFPSFLQGIKYIANIMPWHQIEPFTKSHQILRRRPDG
jgi:hypothetical protein